MRREASTPRPGWQQKLERLGFDYYMLEGKAYWTEQACYAFTSDEIDTLEAATEALHGLCLKAVEHVVANKLWERMRIPPAWGDYIEQVWRRADPTICGRFDLAFDGKGPPKLLEYNADTPTALYEAAVVQWYWLKDTKPDADQFNSIHEKLIEAWRGVLAKLPPEGLVHFARFEDHPEDLATSEYLRDTALQAGLAGKPIAVPQVGWNGRRFTDTDEMPIQVMSKLYPWEWMVREEFGAHVLTDTTAFIEPAWKMILSNKMLLPLLWEGFPGHANLLPAFDTRASRPRQCLREEADLRPRGPQRHHRRPRPVRHRGGRLWQRGLCLAGLPAAAGVRRQPRGRGLVGDRGPAGRHRHARGRAAHHSQQQPIRATLFRTGRQPMSEIWMAGQPAVVGFAGQAYDPGAGIGGQLHTQRTHPTGGC